AKVCVDNRGGPEMRRQVLCYSLICCALCGLAGGRRPAAGQKPGEPGKAKPAPVHRIEEGYVDAGGGLIYYKAFGQGEPLLILHGGPGASHDYFLPHLVPLARHNRLIFLDERGSGKSQKLQDPAGYTVEAMVEDTEAVRAALGLGRVKLLGHSCGGVPAQAY